MTREDRQTAIDNYLVYLDTVYADVFSSVNRSDTNVFILGFSQGSETAARWVTSPNMKAERLILWAGGLPGDMDLVEHRQLLSDLQLTMVVGDTDDLISPRRVLEEKNRIRDAGISFQSYTFEGGHRLDLGILRTIASS